MSETEPNQNTVETGGGAGRSKLTLAVEVLAGGLFYVLGDDFTNKGYVRTGLFFHYLVACATVILLADLSFKKWTKRVWVGVGTICVGLLGLYCFLSPSPKMAPLLVMYMNSSISKKSIYFTNDFLFVKTLKEHPKAPILVIPVSTNQTNITLWFGVVNYSATPYETVSDPDLTADVAGLRICFLSTNAPPTWKSSPTWDRVAVGDQSPENNITFTFPNSLIPGHGEAAPAITFDLPPPFGIPSKIPVLAMISAKRIPRIMIVFNICFVPMDRITEPYFVMDGVYFVLPKGDTNAANPWQRISQ